MSSTASGYQIANLGDDLFPWPWMRNRRSIEVVPLLEAQAGDLVPWPFSANAKARAVLPAEAGAILLTLKVEVANDFRCTVTESPIYAYAWIDSTRPGGNRDGVYPVTVSGAQLLRVEPDGDAGVETVRFIWTGRRWDPLWLQAAVGSPIDWSSYDQGKDAITHLVTALVRRNYRDA